MFALAGKAGVEFPNGFYVKYTGMLLLNDPDHIVNRIKDAVKKYGKKPGGD